MHTNIYAVLVKVDEQQKEVFIYMGALMFSVCKVSPMLAPLVTAKKFVKMWMLPFHIKRCPPQLPDAPLDVTKNGNVRAAKEM